MKSLKFQIYDQNVRFCLRFQNLCAGSGLEFEYWNLFGIWILEIGAFPN